MKENTKRRLTEMAVTAILEECVTETNHIDSKALMETSSRVIETVWNIAIDHCLVGIRREATIEGYPDRRLIWDLIDRVRM